MTVNHTSILRAHRATKKAVMYHGSSGVGKSSMLEAYAREEGMKVVKVMTCYIDPMAIMVPRIDEKAGHVRYWPADWLHALCNTQEPTVLFLDEFNRAPSPQTMAFLTELLLDRSVAGMKIADCVQIVAAANLSEEDVGVIEVPNAIMNRLTHITLAPDTMEMIANMRTDTAKKALKINSKFVSKPRIPELHLNACPRQIDACCELFDSNLVEGEELAVICRGRLGLEAGNALAGILMSIKQQKKHALPSDVLPKYFNQISRVEAAGNVIEVSGLLQDASEKDSQAKHVADYLMRHGSPEICRSVMQSKKLKFIYPKDAPPVDGDGKVFNNKDDGTPMAKGGLPYQIYLMRIGKLKPQSEA